MSSIKHFSFPTNKKISAQVADTLNNYLWVGYEQDSSGNCLLNKQSAFSPDELYFSLSRAIARVNDLFIINENMLAAYDDETYLGEIISTTNPLTSATLIPIPVGVNEAPVAVVASDLSSRLFFLTPGISGGENAKIVIIADYIADFDQIVDLPTVFNALSMTIDANGDLWLVTNTNPANVVRVYESSPNVWAYAVTPIV